MNTLDGVVVFLYSLNNNHIKAILDVWKKLLESPSSMSILHTGKDGWLGEAALKKFRESGGMAFEEMYDCDKSKPAWGFKSWDDFFKRPLCQNPVMAQCLPLSFTFALILFLPLLVQHKAHTCSLLRHFRLSPFPH